ncbi:hypothetical protein JOC37_001776 [Desulfohalotomaculum tongense]|uniref:hypothetical protein n=1 Tax=Desulforadius tongensis TaxID=1216062 RepID=UPI00195D294F|nr:hypothetical protein [Desulforadius tongensis]MBM7855382.1 hypothetical protein [Desulforadius tongensis]
MFDVICYRLKGHLQYQSEIVPAGTPINEAIENIQNVEETLRFTGYSNEKEAKKFIDKFQSDSSQ